MKLPHRSRTYRIDSLPEAFVSLLAVNHPCIHANDKYYGIPNGAIKISNVHFLLIKMLVAIFYLFI